MTVQRASIHNTTQNSSDNLPSYLQTNIIAQMLSIGGEGKFGRPCWVSKKYRANHKTSQKKNWKKICFITEYLQYTNTPESASWPGCRRVNWWGNCRLLAQGGDWSFTFGCSWSCKSAKTVGSTKIVSSCIILKSETYTKAIIIVPIRPLPLNRDRRQTSQTCWMPQY